MKGARVAAALAAGAAALVLAGCGVPPSGVIQAGDPATGMTPGVSLYFLSGGSLVAVPRPVPVGAGAGTAIRLLFNGPTEPESGKLATELPQLKIAPDVQAGGHGMLVIRLFEDVGPFSALAMDQLMCTVAAAPAPPDEGVPARVPGTVSTAKPAHPPAGARQDPTAGWSQVLIITPSWNRTRPDAPCPAG